MTDRKPDEKEGRALTVRVGRALHKQLRRLSYETEKPIAQLVREALERAYGPPEPPAEYAPA